MVYMGGKQKLAKYIVPILNIYIKENKITNFYDIMCGGFNIGSQIQCENIYANDLSPTLIALHQLAQKNSEKICQISAREQWDRCYSEYKRIKAKNFKDSQIPLSEIGAIEWLASFCGRGFPGGYGVKSEGRNLFNERLKNLVEQSKLPAYQKAIFTQKDYREIQIAPNSLIYCDAPYRDTKTYGINKGFDYDAYYNWLLDVAQCCPVFVSEQFLPDTIPYKIVWQKEIKRDLGNGKAATENLFFLDLRKE